MSGPTPREPWWVHALSVGWLLGAALAMLAPALAHGPSLGPFDLLAQYGLLRHPGTSVHNPEIGDQIDAILAWTTLAWREVHQGHLPLWDPYSALGMPLAFNWQSGAFGLQAAVGYLFPLKLAYTAQAVTTLLVAGTGAYVFGRVVRLGTLACVFAATAFELSGAMVGWLGWPHAAVLAFIGWWFAAAVLVVRGRHRTRAVVMLAVVVALAVYAGQPEVLVLLGLAFALFCIVLLLAGVFSRRPMPMARPLGGLVLGTGAGVCLAAPLLLPGLQLASGSLRNATIPAVALSPETLSHVVFSSFDGLPIKGSVAISPFYNETAAVVGVIVVVLALVALARRLRQPVVLALGVTTAAMAAVVWVEPVVKFLNSLPAVGHLAWHRALLPMVFGLAALAGVGADCVVREWRQAATRRWLAGSFGAAAVLLAGAWLFGRGHLSSRATSVRADSFLWPLSATVLGLALTAVLWWLGSRRRQSARVPRWGRDAGWWALASMLAFQTAFLAASGAPISSSSPSFFSTTPAVRALQKTVGSSLVGFGSQACFLPPGLGIPVNDNVVYGVDELAVYDPMVPRRYFAAWTSATKQLAGIDSYYFYCPNVTSTALARLYGVSYLLEHAGVPAPAGAVFVRRLSDEDLYRVPQASSATVSPIGPGGRLPPAMASGTPVPVGHPGPASLRVVTDASVSQVLRLRVTAVPGWHATVDGRSVAVSRFAGIMLQLVVPPGRHVVVLRYWPSAFSTGLVLAAASAAALVAALAVSAMRRRVTRRRPPVVFDSVVLPPKDRSLEEVLS